MVMELVNVNLFAEAYYSGSIYEDNIWIKKSSYEKLMSVFPEEISCGELDGKHSEVMGEVKVQDYSYTDEYYAKNSDITNDGDYLELSLRDLYESNGLDWVEEQKEIIEYIEHRRHRTLPIITYMERAVVLDEFLQQLFCFGLSLSRLFKGVDDSFRPRLAFVFKSQLFLFFGFLFCDNSLFGFFALFFCFIDLVGHLTVIFHIVLL